MKSVKHLLRPAVRRILSPRTVQILRFRWWCLSSYVPGLLRSRLARRAGSRIVSPQVRSFGSALSPSCLMRQLENVDVLAPTEMCRVMTKHGSDKARGHNYTTVYSALFQQYRHQSLRILELGLGSNNQDVPSNMGVFGAPGASLRGWREFFPQALVYGADVDRRILFQEDQITTFFCDQLDPSSIRELWSYEDLQDGADVIIEDGLHTFEANVSFLQGSLGHLRPGGTYVVEDITHDDVNRWYEWLETTCAKVYPEFEFAFVVLPNASGFDHNNLLIARRGDN